MIPVESIDTRSYIATVFFSPVLQDQVTVQSAFSEIIELHREYCLSRLSEREREKKNATSKIRLNRRWKITNRKKKKINKHKDKQNNLPQ